MEVWMDFKFICGFKHVFYPVLHFFILGVEGGV